MSERKINLEEILLQQSKEELGDNSWISFRDVYLEKPFEDLEIFITEAMKEACRQVLELAAENAKVIKNEHTSQILSNLIDKQSILNTINQVE